MRERRRFTSFAIALLALTTVSGCAGKAQALKVGAAQFEQTSVTAIESVVALNRKRIAPAELTENEILENVVSGFQEAIDSNSVGVLDYAVISNLRNPLAVNAPKSDAAAAAFVGKMRNDYRTFAAIFDRLDEGSFLATDSVKEALPFAKKLTAQLVILAKIVDARPLEFTVVRAKLASDIKKTLAKWKADNVDVNAQRPTVDAWLQKQKAIAADEASAKQAVAEKLAKAASLGYDVSNQIENYDQLSLADITEALQLGISIAEGLTGDDLSSIEGRIGEIVAGINSDPSWSSSVSLALRELNDSGVLQGESAEVSAAARELTGSGTR